MVPNSLLFHRARVPLKSVYQLIAQFGDMSPVLIPSYNAAGGPLIMCVQNRSDALEFAAFTRIKAPPENILQDCWCDSMVHMKRNPPSN